MLDVKMLLELQGEDINMLNILLTELPKLAKEAEAAEKLIKETYSFKIGEDYITVWSDEHNREFITKDGIWQARYLHQSYDVTCTTNGIYKLFKEEYLYEKKYVEGKQYREAPLIAGYFRNFISLTERKKKERK